MKDRDTVGIFSYDPNPLRGGLDTLVRVLSHYLNAKWEYDVACVYEEISPMKTTAVERGEAWHNHPIWSPPLPLFLRMKYLARRWEHDGSARFGLVIGFHEWVYLAAKAASVAECPLVSCFFTTYSDEVQPQWAPDPILSRLAFHVNARFAKQVDALTGEAVDQSRAIIVSGPSALDVVSKVYSNARRTFTIPPGVDTTRFHPKTSPEEGRFRLRLAPEQSVVLYVGQFIRRKGLETLIRAFERVHKKMNSSILLLVGDGPESRRISKLVRALDIANSVIFAGTVSTEELPGYYRAADLFVLPSFQEGFGMVLLEAMASGLPVIATRITGVSDVIQDGVNGVLVNPGDVTELAEAVTRILSDDDLQRKRGKVARKMAVEQYDWSAILEKWDLVLRKLE